MFELMIVTIVAGMPTVNTTPYTFNTEAECRTAASALLIHLTRERRIPAGTKRDVYCVYTRSEK